MKTKKSKIKTFCYSVVKRKNSKIEIPSFPIKSMKNMFCDEADLINDFAFISSASLYELIP